MNTIFVAIILALSATAVLAEPLPVEKPRGPGGSCPNGFISSGFTGSAHAIATSAESATKQCISLLPILLNPRS